MEYTKVNGEKERKRGLEKGNCIVQTDQLTKAGGLMTYLTAWVATFIPRSQSTKGSGKMAFTMVRAHSREKMKHT
jgi:hypothetical protein